MQYAMHKHDSIGKGKKPATHRVPKTEPRMDQQKRKVLLSSDSQDVLVVHVKEGNGKRAKEWIEVSIGNKNKVILTKENPGFKKFLSFMQTLKGKDIVKQVECVEKLKTDLDAASYEYLEDLDNILALCVVCLRCMYVERLFSIEGVREAIYGVFTMRKAQSILREFY